MYRRLRRWFFVASIAVAAPFLQHLYSQAREQTGLSGRTGSNLTAFDRVISDLMDRWQLPGGQLAIAKDHRLVLDRSYGYADIELKERVTQTSLFRIGSVSKTITTAAVLTLVDRGHLRLEDKAIRRLGDLAPPRNASVDPRLYEITIQDLLQHGGGWDTAKSFAPLGLPWSRMAAATVGAEDPPTCATVLRYMLSIPLDFDPGTRTAYSNFGYCILGLVIEETLRSMGKEMSYEDYVRRAVLARHLAHRRSPRQQCGMARSYRQRRHPCVHVQLTASQTHGLLRGRDSHAPRHD